MLEFQPYKKPMTNDKIIISIRLDEEKLNKIEQVANKFDISRNELINQCINFALDNLKFESKK